MVNHSWSIGGRAADERGFSLVELMIVGLITAMIVGSAIAMSTQVNKTYSHQLNDAAVQQEARFALEWITRVLSAAGSNPYAIVNSACPVPGTPFTPIWLDPNGNGVQDDVRVHADVTRPNGLLLGLAGACNEQGEDVTIGIQANAAPAANAITRFDRAVDAAAVPITDQVFTRLRFTYLTAARAVTVNPAQIAYVQVDLTGRTRSQIDGAGRHVQGAGTFTTWAYRSEVRVRAR
jgi:Tfp pilus assembly protein PilW